MEDIDLKNMVILKDLPSNIVKEAYVVFKSNKMIKKFQKINKNTEQKQVNRDNEDSQYAIKEAEMLVSSYIAKLENRNNKKLKSKENIQISTLLVLLIALIKVIII